MTSIEEIARTMTGYVPALIDRPTKRHGSVAMILRDDGSEPHVLFVERARRQGDPWSGHIAFPGGTIEPDDAGPRQAAERETMEEIGLDLRPGSYLGRLDDLTGATLPVVVSGFVYAVSSPGPLTLSVEIQETFWTPLSLLTDATRRVEHRFRYGDAERSLPAIDLLGPGRPVLWGLTYRFIRQFLGLIGREAPEMREG